ncbi:MAG: prepilin-type N-terminal cleavage/methylation domain-containing protein [Candidatus Marinimicrobia bacterium]|nr:prepilin-type N-terminal cleavage/methylation domain-containing protein [Candidatus Neomarinimicrobiota bacterium]
MKQENIQKHPNGFTFIELIMVLIIVGILGSMVFTRILNNLNPIKVRAAIEQITSDIEQTKALSMAQHDTITIAFNIANDSYSIYNGSTENQTIMTDYPGSNNGVISFDQTEYSGVDISSASFGNSTNLSFDPWGNTILGGTITLNSDNVITVQTVTGHWAITTP